MKYSSQAQFPVSDIPWAPAIGGLVIGIVFIAIFTLNVQVNHITPIASNNSCDTLYQEPTSSLNPATNLTVTIHASVFFMKEGQTARLCLQFTGDQSQRIFSGTLDTQVLNSGNATNTSTTSLVHGSARQISNVTGDVLYEFTAANNSKGVYRILPALNCPGLPLAVGFNSTSQLERSDFSWLHGTYYCPGVVGLYKLTGTSGLDVQEFSVVTPP